MSQEKGCYITIWGGAGPTGLSYKVKGVSFADPKNNLLLGGQAGIGFSYYFTKNIGISIGADVAHYRTKTVLKGNFQRDSHFFLGNYTDNDLESRVSDYELRVRTQNWTEYQSAHFVEIPLMINFQKKFGEKEYFGLYLGVGAKFQIPILSKYSIRDGDRDPRLLVTGYYPEDKAEFGGWKSENDPGDPQHPLPQHGFGTITNPSEVLSGAKGKLDLKWNIALVGEAGILISLSRRVDLALGAFIDYGLLNVNKKKENPTALFTGTETDYIAGAENNIGKGITYNSLLKSTYEQNKRYVDRINTFSYGGKLGIRIKLGKLSQKEQPQVAFTPCDKDTVFIYKFEPQPYPPIDSILKEVMDALKEMPREPARVEEVYQDEFPAYIPEEDIDFLFGPIYFDLDKSTLRPESIIDLDKKVEILNKYPELRLVIYGNTCDLGNDPYNFKLGQRRAEAARNYLINKGIAPERLESSTLSRFQPEKPNTNEPNRSHNRRDDFKPIYKKK
jgi:peptidoglycan-associated lipoprotein